MPWRRARREEIAAGVSRAACVPAVRRCSAGALSARRASQAAPSPPRPCLAPAAPAGHPGQHPTPDGLRPPAQPAGNWHSSQKASRAPGRRGAFRAQIAGNPMVRTCPAPAGLFHRASSLFISALIQKILANAKPHNLEFLDFTMFFGMLHRISPSIARIRAECRITFDKYLYRTTDPYIVG